MNIAEEISKRARPERAAIVAGERVLDYATLLGEAEASAAWLRRHLDRPQPGVIPRIGLACPNGVDYITAALGILRAGACLVPVPDELTPMETTDLATRTALHGVVRVEGGTSHWQPLGGGGVDFDEAAFAALDPAFIRFSSGTTGASKGVVLSHGRLVERITAANDGLGIGEEDRVLWMLPMAHHFAVSIILYLYHGACTVLVDSPLAGAVLEIAEKTRATVIYGSPFHFALLAADRSGFRWPSLRLAVSTAAALPEETATRIDARFGKPLVQGLGVIEVGLPLLNLDDARAHPTSLGKPLPRYRIELRDDAGHPLPPGEVGELWVKGPGFFDAYLSPWRMFPDVCPGGWFATGDLAEVDAAGRVFLRGRRKSVLNISGMKVFPEEIEAVLDAHPGVRRSRVAGRAHPVFGTIPLAEVVPRDAAAPPAVAELIALCRRSLSAFKVPVKIAIVAAIEMTASGKIRRS